jgi:hypothetical protein
MAVLQVCFAGRLHLRGEHRFQRSFYIFVLATGIYLERSDEKRPEGPLEPSPGLSPPPRANPGLQVVRLGALKVAQQVWYGAVPGSDLNPSHFLH